MEYRAVMPTRSAVHRRSALTQVLPAALPWVRFLPGPAVDAFAIELVDTVHSAAAIDNMAPVSQLLAEWRHTAEVYADSELHEVLTRPHEGDHGSVPAPDVAVLGQT